MNSTVPASSWRLVVVDATAGLTFVTGMLTFALSLLTGVAVINGDQLPGWGDPLNDCLSACFYLSPIAGGAAAMHAGWLRRSGMASIAETAPDGSWRMLTVAAAATWAWSLLSYGGLVAVALLTANLSGPFSLSMLLLPVQGVVLVSAAVAVGLLIGARLPFVWTPPLVTIALFIILNYLDLTNGPLDRFSMTYAFVFYQINLVPNSTLLIGVILTALGVGASALVLLRLLTQGRAAIPSFIVVCVLLTSGVVTTLRAEPSDVVFRTGGEVTCRTEAAIRLCVFKESEPQLAPSVAALVRARAAAEPIFDVPGEFRQRDVDSPQPDATSIDLAPNSERFGYLGRAVGAVVPGVDCVGIVADREELQALILERLQPGIAASAQVRRMATQPVAAQRAWAASRIERLRSCR